MSAESSEWIDSAPLRSASFSDLSIYCTDAISELERELEIVTNMNLKKKQLLCESYVQEVKRRDLEREKQIAELINLSKKEDANHPVDFSENLFCSECNQDSRYGDLIVICDRCERGWHQVTCKHTNFESYVIKILIGGLFKSCHGISEIPSGEWFCMHCAKRDLQKLEVVSVRGIPINPTNLLREVKRRGGFNHVNKVRGSWVSIGRSMEMPAVTNLSFLLKQAYKRYFHSDPSAPTPPRRPVGRPRGSGKGRGRPIKSDNNTPQTPPRKRTRTPKLESDSRSTSKKRKYTKRKLKVDGLEAKSSDADAAKVAGSCSSNT